MERSPRYDKVHNEETQNRFQSSRTSLIVEILRAIVNILLFILESLWLIGKAIIKLILPATLKPVKGEIVLITGAGSGIGRALALQYASEGAIVVCWDINRKGNLETVDEITKLDYPKAYAYVCNVANREEVMIVAEKVKKDVGDVTILINNAGIMPHRPFLNHTPEAIHQIVDTNLMAHFWTLQAFLPAMIKKNIGHIVAISSGAGLMGLRNLVPYCVSKYGVRGLMETLYTELLADPKCQIKTTCVYLGPVSTALYNSKYLRLGYPNLTPILTPKDVAKRVIKAQRSNVFEMTLPRYLLKMIYFLKLFPVELVKAFWKYMDTYIQSDLNEIT